MQKLFPNGNEDDGRYILIIIENNTALFYFKKDYDWHFRWLGEQENDIDEEQKKPSEFYWIGGESWFSKHQRFPEHMMKKRWFTPEMSRFLTENLLPNDNR